MNKRSGFQWFRVFHKWAGLTAALWLIVLGGTGFVLDHPEWRFSNQVTVPEAWGSPDLTAFIRITYMRQMLVDQEDSQRWLGGSERGLWTSLDGGQNWSPIEFSGRDYSPQVLSLLADPERGFAAALIATDEGIWRLAENGLAEQLVLGDFRINSMSAGPTPASIVGVADNSSVFSLDTQTNVVSWPDMQPIEPVISGGVTLNRYVLNTHFGHGLFEDKAGIIINDYSGIAMIILGVSGSLYWFMRRRWRKQPQSATPQKKRRVTAWLYRSHAPIIGVLAIIPIFYVSVTGIFGDHIRSIYAWTESKTVPAMLVPAGFSMRTLAHDVQGVVVNPADVNEWIIATRKGLYASSDGGQVWSREQRLPIQKADYGKSLNLFRVNNSLFLGAGLNASYVSDDGGKNWSTVTGPFTTISSGGFSDGKWYVKNSQGVFAGESPTDLTLADVKPPPMTGMPLFLFLADIHTGLAIAPWWPWVNDLFAVLAIILVASGPVIWWRRKWM